MAAVRESVPSYQDFFKTLPIKAQALRQEVEEAPYRDRIGVLNHKILPPSLINLFYWMDLYHEKLGKHGTICSFLGEIIVNKLRDEEDERQLKPRLNLQQEIGIVGGAAIHELGQLTYDKQMIEQRRKGSNHDTTKTVLAYPAVGSFIFWENFSAVPEEMSTKKMITAAILYHNIKHGSVKDIVFDKIRLGELISNLPLITQAKYRKVATIVALIDKAVTFLENNKEDPRVDPTEKLRRVLNKKIAQIINHFSRFNDFNEEEKKLYFRVKNCILSVRRMIYNLITT
jgi:hypothetical protein